MATMVKEKKPKKKKPKIRCAEAKEEVEDLKLSITQESESNLVDLNINITNSFSQDQNLEQQQSDIGRYKEFVTENTFIVDAELSNLDKSQQIENDVATGSEVWPLHESLQEPSLQGHSKSEVQNIADQKTLEELSQLKLESHTVSECGVLFKDVNAQLDNITNKDNLTKEESAPSAPIFYEPSKTFEASIPKEIACIAKPKTPCLTMEEAIRIFCGQEMYVVKELSDQEEALVEVGGHLQPQHPLVDLITHLRSSLVAVERERQRISQGYREEQAARSQLWKVEKRKKYISEKCNCGADVSLSITYDYAELQNNKLAAAKFRLESLLKDVLDSYCSHQHEAMLTYCEIEDLIGLILQRSREEIRDCLAFILQSLKCSDEFGDVFVKLLQEWAFTLAAALFDKEPDMRDLLFLTHLLFRQSRSVRWAGRVVRMRVEDFDTAARFIAFLDILLSQPVPESAVECTEDVQEASSEAWEELDVCGSGGAVGKGRLREGDLLALLNAFPIRDLIASLMLLSEQEMDGKHAACWRGATGGGVLKGACGVRVLLNVVARALPQYRAYAGVHALLRRVARATLTSLAALHLQSRLVYQKDIEERISAELEACFVLGFSMLVEDRHLLPTTLLSDETVSDYCYTLMSSLHVDTPCRIERLDIEAPAMSCAERVRIVSYAAAQQHDSSLANRVLKFLLQTGIKQKSETCKGKCETTARELIAHVLAAHIHLHTPAFYMLADISDVESLDPMCIKYLSPEKWRPSPTDIYGVLDYWSRKCPAFIEKLLHLIDCTPHTGVLLESQLVVGSWLCGYARGRAETEWAWSALRRLRTHRALWGLPLDTPPPQHTDALMDAAFALLSSEWGHLVPLVCSVGVSALRRLAATRVTDAVHCLDCVMRVLALSPESISHTPELTEVFTLILNAGPSLVQRAFGRGGRSGQQMLQQLVLDQLREYRNNEMHRSAILSAWLYALWNPALPPASRAILDMALRTTHDLRTKLLDAHVMYALEEGKTELISDGVTHANVAPLLALGALRGAQAFELRAGVATRLLPTLDQQRRAGEKIHVDNALKFIGSKLSSEELVIHRTAAAILLAPLEDPAHLMLWSLFFHLYLQRPNKNAREETPPAGPLFFRGIVKSRTYNKLKKRLQDTIAYHRDAIKELKTQVTPTEETGSVEVANIMDDCILPPLTLKDLRGDTNLESETSIDQQGVEKDTEVKTNTPNHISLQISYHTGAERMVVMHENWLSKEDKVRALPHHADISRYLTEQELDSAWRASLRDVISTPDTPPPAPDPAPAFTYYELIINAINEFHTETRRRQTVRRSSSLPNINYNDQASVIAQVKKYLAAVDKLIASWCSETKRARALDTQLWPVVGRLRTRCVLPGVKLPCPKGCKPVLVKIQEHDWRLSSIAEREIEENRRSAATVVRRLAHPKTDAVRVTAALIAISRRINDKSIAIRVLEIMYCSVNDVNAPAHRSLVSFINFLAERWVCADGAACARLLQRWSSAGAHALCTALVHPERPHVRQWRALYVMLLHAPLQPVAVFSYLSRFDMAYWATAVSEEERLDVLESLYLAASRYGQYNGEEYQMLIELVGVHSGKVCQASDTLNHVSRCVRAATSAALPAAYLAHLTPLVTAHRQHLHFAQLEQLFGELGAMWCVKISKKEYEAYAPHIAALLRALLRQYVVAFNEQSYMPENVGDRAWSAAASSWAPWVSPGSSQLLIADPDRYTAVLADFVDTLGLMMDDCPGSDVFVLRHTWEWAVEMYVCSHRGHARRAAALMAEMRRLPWARQWRVSAALHTAHKVACLNLPDLSAWVSHTWDALSAATWIAGATHVQLCQILPVLFQIFTSKFMQLTEQTLQEACRLPWAALSPQIMEQLLDAYYTAYHNPAQPYHDLPHFKLVLRVSELGASCGLDEVAQAKRCVGVSVWTSRAAAPALRAHVPAHVHRLLREIHDTAPRIENCSNYLEKLMCRAIVLLSLEPNALPIWQKWVCSCTARTRRAVAVACGTLGAAQTFAPFIDTLAQQILHDTDSGGWSVVWRPLEGRPGAGAALRQQHYYAAYALLRAAPLAVDDARAAFTALAAATVNFAENEVIISLWVCALCRIACQFADAAGGEVAERAAAARDVCTLLTKWAGLKRSLIQVVTLQHATVPTLRHRLLCFLGLCILSKLPSTGVQSPYKEYENACQSSSSLGINVSDIIKWGQSPKPSYLPRLAVMLFPDRKDYFEEELRLAPTDL